MSFAYGDQFLMFNFHAINYTFLVRAAHFVWLLYIGNLRFEEKCSLILKNFLFYSQLLTKYFYYWCLTTTLCGRNLFYVWKFKELRSVFWLTVYVLPSQSFLLNFPFNRVFWHSSEESAWGIVRCLFIHNHVTFFWYSIYKLGTR
jgi:hypothetical protein